MALPLILSNTTVPLLGLSNTVIAGHLPSSNYLAAIGLGTMIFNFLYWSLAFFRMSSTGLIAQAFGAKDAQAMQQTLLHSLILALTIGLALVALQYPIYALVHALIHPDSKVIQLLKAYFFTRIWGAPAVLINFVLVGTMVAIQKPRGPLILLGLTNLLAIVLSIIFVFALRLDIKGIALADVIAQYVGLATGLIILSAYFNFKRLLSHSSIKLAKLIQLLHANRDIFIRTLCLIFVFTFFTIWSSHISPLILAANTLLMNFFQIMANALGGFDNVAEALAGEAVGKKSQALFRQSISDVGAWALLFSLCIMVIYFSLGRYFIQGMTSIEAVRMTATQYLPYASLLPIIAFPSFLFDGVAIGANLFKQMRNSMLASLLIFFLVWLLLKNLGNPGLWIAFITFFIARGVFLGYYAFAFQKTSFMRR